RIGEDDLLVEVRCLPSRAGEVLGTPLSLRGSPVSGRFLLSGDVSEAELVAEVARLRERAGPVRVLASPYEIDRWGEVGSLALMRRVKERFDPGRRMSPGRFVGGI
ncbi:MAG: FAD-binding oxidoreductase, partial [Nonomuraea sp.]|nr:FAD-binding oxidoreductase [Nonomuraea sp.]